MENFYIELIVSCPECQNIEELRQTEGKYIRKMGTLNKCIEARTNKEYREDNNEEIRQNKHIYYERNKDKYKDKNTNTILRI